ncbi:class I SAM-dependent methyltransferase [Leptospira interrogans]|nr:MULTISPECIES: class I SAM-dependent methyltransferase [Leptospira]APH42002.1 SAM-dependent methyltransferase [Leptospira interrogans serovar Copenhageni/Icterohaemorrhagiae]AAS70752.1 methyltransferase [Leptospira interrogans serovar Copenhageni str. Fiocruz L1-130]EMY54739.1 methyltransferase domain protein [Leptospira interrogans serovar Copenhageni str. M20]KPA24445.1 Methyltransferase [Leptospira interrogans]MBO7985716.1 class I SAM-dependent methyltransferase [Leptospira interrogans se
MREEEYILMDQLEERMWWFQALRRIVRIVLTPYLADSDKIFDAGCGTGGMLQVLEKYFPRIQLYGLDYSFEACKLSRRKTNATIDQGSIMSIPFKNEFFDVLLSLDVLEHKSVDPSIALNEFNRCLKKGGYLLLNLPAYDWMLSYHDEAVEQIRRFSVNQIRKELNSKGFQIIYITYWNSFLFPLMVLRRKIFTRKDRESDVKSFHPLIEFIFKSFIKLEECMISWRIFLPFGGSVLVLAKKES